MSTAPNQPPSTPTTHIAIVVDASSSIVSYRLIDKMIDMVNADIDVAKAQAQGQKITVTMVVFADYARLAVDAKRREIRGVDPETLQHIGRDDYQPHGNTALFDGVKMAIEVLRSLPGANDENTSFLVKVVTDGEENYSTNRQRAIAMIRELADDDRWTFAFSLPRGHKAKFCRDYSVAEGNVAEWEQTAEGADKVRMANTTAMTTFLAQRTKGVRSTRSYYEVNTAQLTQRLVKAELKDRSADFRLYAVNPTWADDHGIAHDKIPIKEYVESVTSASYVTGSTYYRLEKREKIQGYKKIALMRKGKPEVYTGDEARALLGLAPGQDLYVVPGNFGEWDIFVQSTSPNRNLRAGSVILVDITMAPSAAIQSTWDTSVAQKCPKDHLLVKHPDAAKQATHLWCRFCKTEHPKPAPPPAPVQASPQLRV